MTRHSFNPDQGPSRHDMVADIMARWPASAAVFVRRGMACPGCVMAPMMTLDEAAAAYRLDPLELLAEIIAEAQVTASA